jgi:hypothetical protein
MTAEEALSAVKGVVDIDSKAVFNLEKFFHLFTKTY